MAFTLLSPAAKVTPGTFAISTVRMGRRDDSPWRLQIKIPTSEFTIRFGDASRFDLLLGDGPDAGALLIRVNEEGGAFRPTRLKSVCIFRLPPTDATPQIEFKGEDPKRKMTSEGGLIVLLPEWAWEPGRWQSIRDARAIAQRQNAAAQTIARKGG